MGIDDQRRVDPGLVGLHVAENGRWEESTLRARHALNVRETRVLEQLLHQREVEAHPVLPITEQQVHDATSARPVWARERHENGVISVEVRSARDFEGRDQNANPTRRPQNPARVAEYA